MWRNDILLTCGEHLHSLIILLRVWVHRSSLTPPSCIEVPVPRLESECVGDTDFDRFYDVPV